MSEDPNKVINSFTEDDVITFTPKDLDNAISAQTKVVLHQITTRSCLLRAGIATLQILKMIEAKTANISPIVMGISRGGARAYYEECHDDMLDLAKTVFNQNKHKLGLA